MKKREKEPQKRTKTNNLMESLNFNLREPNKKSATQLYCVLKTNEKQYKISTGFKLNPWQWDSKKQRPHSNATNAIEITKAIYNITIAFQTLCLSGKIANDFEAVNFIKSKTNNNNNNNNMANTANLTAGGKKKASTLIKRGLEKYTAQRQALGKINEPNLMSFLNQFTKWFEDNGKNTVSTLSTKGLETFKNYCIESGKSATQTNKVCKQIASFINRYIAPTQTNFADVKYIPLQEVKKAKDDTIYHPLMPNEVEALENVTDIRDYQTEARDAFLMICYTGCRTEDLVKVFGKEYALLGENVAKMETQKRNVYAYIQLDEKIKALQQKYKDGFKFLKLNEITKSVKFNKNLRVVAEKAKLNREIAITDAFGVKKTFPLHAVISSYYGRYTFIFKQLNVEKRSVEAVAKMVGHTDSTMIQKVYGRWNDDTIVEMVTQKAEKINNETTTHTNNNAPLTAPLTEQDIKTAIAVIYEELEKPTGIDIAKLFQKLSAEFGKMRATDFVESSPLHYQIIMEDLRVKCLSKVAKVEKKDILNKLLQ